MLNNIETNVATSSRYQKIVSSVSMDESIQNSITGVLSSRPHRDERSRRDLSALWAWPWPWHESGKLQWVARAKFRCRRSRLFGFSRRWPESGRFGRFSGPRGPKWRIHFWHLTQKERRGGRPECTQVTLFPYNCWVSAAKTRFGPVSGVPGPKRVLGNGRNRPKATGRNYAAGPFMHESGKLQWVERAKFRWRCSRLFAFSRRGSRTSHQESSIESSTICFFLVFFASISIHGVPSCHLSFSTP